MAFNSEKWALSFYGEVDEQLQIETDMFQLHIYRKSGIEKLEAKRGEGTLAIFIPQDWKMERYKCQELLRRLLLSEVKEQAKIIFEQRTMYYAERYGIPCKRVELETRYNYIGKCNKDKRMIKYNPWVICGSYRRHIDYLVCHELAHFFCSITVLSFGKLPNGYILVWNLTLRRHVRPFIRSGMSLPIIWS